MKSCPPSRASDLFYTARLVDAATLKDWGLINEVVAPERLMSRALEIAREIGHRSPEAVAHIKFLTGSRSRSADRQSRIAAELERFAANTLAYIQREGHLLVDEPDVPDVEGVDFKDRHVLIVVRGMDYKEDLAILRRSGYLREQRPLLIGVDGGADALREIGEKPDVIIGDFDSVSEETLRGGARLIVHGYRSGKAPGAQRLDDLGLDYEVYGSEGTSEDIAMLLAYEKGAELIVAVGTHNSMVEFLDKGREGMASTFLVRMKVGPMLVDAKGVSRLYRTASVRTRDLLFMVLAAIFTFAIVIAVSEPLRLVLRSSWLTLTS